MKHESRRVEIRVGEIVLERLRALPSPPSWNVGVYQSTLDYGTLQDTRSILTETLAWQPHRPRPVQVQAVHYHTGIPRRSPGAIPFREDAYGLKFGQTLDRRSTVQIHGATLRNTDALTDKGTILGGRWIFTPAPHWSWGLEMTRSRFTGWRVDQWCPATGYRFSPQWRLDLEGLAARIRGEALPEGISQRFHGLRSSATWNPTSRLQLGLSWMTGPRRGEFRSAGMYSYNTLDLYRHAGELSVLATLTGDLMLFAQVATSRLESAWQQAANRQAGGPRYDPDHILRQITLGLSTSF